MSIFRKNVRTVTVTVRPEITPEQALVLLAQDRASFELTANIRTDARRETPAPGR